jgi:flagellar M-ring protein FliF
VPNVSQLASRLTPRGWLVAGAATIAGILFIYLFLHTVSKPSYTTLVTGVNPAQTGKMTSALSAHGVNYQLQNNGTAIAVQDNQSAQARVALAGSGLLGNTQPGFELFDHPSLGESNFQQQVTYQRALQGQLEATIDSVQGVSGAQVTLVLPNPQNQVFGENNGAASAAVLLSGTGALDQSSVRGIAQLVASSVPGLQLNKVTITGASGQLLWPSPNGGAGGGGSGGAKQEAEQRYDESTAANLQAMLAQTLGPGKAQVLVYANMNVDQTTKESLEYAKAGTPLQQTKSLETLSGNGSSAAATGTANLPAAAQNGGKSNYKRETSTSQNGVSKTVTHSTVAPGTVETQHVSVLLDHSVPASSIPAIKEAVTNAAGINAKRGDTISIGQIAFAKGGATGEPASGGMMGYAKYVLLAIAAAVFLFFTTRSLRRREKEEIPEPRWLRELEAPVRLSELEREMAARPGELTAAAGGPNGRANGRNGSAEAGEEIRRQVEQLADSDPDRVAQQVRSWIQEG